MLELVLLGSNCKQKLELGLDRLGFRSGFGWGSNLETRSEEDYLENKIQSLGIWRDQMNKVGLDWYKQIQLKMIRMQIKIEIRIRMTCAGIFFWLKHVSRSASWMSTIITKRIWSKCLMTRLGFIWIGMRLKLGLGFDLKSVSNRNVRFRTIKRGNEFSLPCCLKNWEWLIS